MSIVKKMNLSGGEVSPAIYSRVDTSKFQAGFRTARNLVVRKDGAMENRQGGGFTTSTRNNKKVYVAEFRVTGQKSFFIEFSDLKIRIMREGAPVANDTYETLDITGITKANPAVVTYVGDDGTPTNGAEIYIDGVSGMHQINKRSYLVKNLNVGAKTFELTDLDGSNINSTAYGTFNNAKVGFVIRSMVLTSPYVEADIMSLGHDQSIDVMKITHQNYPPRDLTRGVSSWSFTVTNFSATVPPNFSGLTLGYTPGSGSTGSVTYAVTGVTPDGEETLDVNITATANLSPNGTYFNNLGWNPDFVGTTFYVYRLVDGVFGLVGTVVSSATGYQANMFRDIGVIPDTTHSIPQSYNPFDGVGNYPSTVCFFQQRTVYAKTILKPETVFASRTGRYDKFIRRSPGDPIRDDDSIEFNIASRSINPVHHLFDLNGLLMMTESSEQYLGNEAMTPSSIRPQAQSYNGTRGDLRPVALNDTIIYLQNLGSVVRELGFQYEVDGYRGDDLTTFATHLFKNKQIVSWAFQQIPSSVLWVVRNDGVLLSMTSVKEQQILAWTRHDFEGGVVENVVCCRELTEDFVYAVVRRVIDGNIVRYYERLPSRTLVDQDSSRFMDSFAEYNGMNTDGENGMKINSVSGEWDYETEMDIQCGINFFRSIYVGDEIHIYDADGKVLIKFTITEVTDALNAKGKPDKTVPVELRNVASFTWGHAIKTFGGLWHLNGSKVSAYGDANVIASVHNSEVEFEMTVANGEVVLDKCYVNVAVGLPITMDLETLNIDTMAGETLVDKRINVSRVTLEVEETRGLFAGQKAPSGTDYLEDLIEIKPRFDEAWGMPNELITGKMDVNIESSWNSSGRVFIRQVDPVPVTFLSVSPSGLIPFRR